MDSKKEIWIEKDLDRTEIPFILSHEYVELRLMRDKAVGYDEAHEICSTMEFELRKNQGVRSFLSPRGRKLRKTDLPKLVSPELFDELLKKYAKR